MADIENQNVLNGETRFISDLYYELAKITILKLVEENVFKLSEPVIDYLPELSNFYDTSLTLELLLKGMGGLPEFDDRSKEMNQWTFDDIFDLYTKWDATQYKPGQGVSAYNPVPICALYDKIVYRKIGKSLSEYFQENIFTPLEMENSGFLSDGEYDDLKKYKRRSTGFLPIEKTKPLVKVYSETVTTLKDLAKLYIALDSGVLLSQKSLDYYYEPFKNQEGIDIIDELNPYSQYYTGYFSLAGYVSIERSTKNVFYYPGSQKAGGIYVPEENVRLYMFSNVPDGDVFNVGYFNVLTPMGLL